MSNIQNKNAIYVNFKKRIYSYTHYTHRDIPLHLKQNNLTNHSTGKNIVGKIYNQKRMQKEKYEMKGENKK